jgi:hypothetical protein
MNKIQLLLSADNEASIQTIKDSLEVEWGRIKNEMPNLDNRLGVRVPGDPTARVPQDGQPDIMPEQPSFDLVLEARGKDVSFSDLGQVLSGVGSRLESLIDRDSSAALVGTEHEIVPGAQRLFLNMLLRRPSNWARSDWKAHWIEHHATEVRENMTGLQGYRQFHTDPVASEVAAKMAGVAISDFDGTAEGYYSDLEKFFETLSDPEVQKDTGFIDHRRSVMRLYTIESWR